MNDPAAIRRLYGRSKGRPLRAGQSDLVERLLPRLSVPEEGPLDLIAAKLEPGGEFRLGTDDRTYCRWAMMIMNRRSDFEWLAESAKDFLTRPGGWPETRYEAKARREGREVWYFRYRRV